MPTTTTGNLEAAQKALGIYYDRIVIESLQPNLYFEQFGTIVGVSQGNYTSRFFTFNKIATSSVTTLTEGTPPTGIAVSVNAIDITPTQYGVNVELTDLVALTAVFDLINTTLNEVGKAMARKIDEVIQTVVNAGTNVIYAGGKTSRADLTAGDLFDADLIRRAAARLRKNAAPEFTNKGGGYVAITTPEVASNLKSNASVGQWIDMHKYANPENLFTGEMGSIDGVRIVQSPNVLTFSSNVTVHPTTFIAKDAYRISYWLANKANTYVLPPESNLSVSNPLGQKGSVGAKTNIGVARTQEERLVRVESAATAV
jgi:N4-gp56 family major capsid protein